MPRLTDREITDALREGKEVQLKRKDKKFSPPFHVSDTGYMYNRYSALPPLLHIEELEADDWEVVPSGRCKYKGYKNFND